MYQGKFEHNYREAQKHMPPLQDKSVSRARGPRRSGAVFYLVFFFYIFAFYLAAYWGLTLLRDWLSDFEAAQPTQKCQQVFDTLFASRDWDALYDVAGVREESRESFTAYMESTVGDGTLTCMATSAGLSNDKKYNVRLGSRKLASFTLTDRNQSKDTAGLPDWQLNSIEFFFDRASVYSIQAPEGCTVLVNGEALDEGSIVRISGTRADAYLPQGVTGPGTVTREVTGLLAKPAVSVLDESGTELAVAYDEAGRSFTAQAVLPSISEEEQTVALDAVKMYALYMIERAGADEVARYFERGTDTYTAIIRTDRSAVQDAQKREFVNESVTGYCRYSDGSFSVRVALTLNLYRASGSVKESQIAQSLFFRKQEGKWKCWQMTAVDVSAPVERVRLVFRNGETVLSDAFYETDLTGLTCPAVPVPEGKVFSGWTVEDRDESGQTVLRLVFQPDGENTVALPGDGTLTPMVLQPLFEDAA